MRTLLESYITADIVLITPSRAEAQKLRYTITFLKKKSPALFRMTTRYLACIVVSRERGYFNEALVGAACWMTQQSLVHYHPPHYLASLLVHEAHHIRQFERGRAFLGRRAETEAYRLQRRFLRQIGDTRLLDYLDRQYDARWWKEESSDRHDHAAFVKIHKMLREGVKHPLRE